MTDILPWITAHWLMLVIAFAFLIFLIVSVSWAFAWYFWRWVIEADSEPVGMPQERIAYGDSPHLPAGYWDAVARAEAKRRSA